MNIASFAPAPRTSGPTIVEKLAIGRTARTRVSIGPLLVVLVLAAAVRLLLVVARPLAIEGEGAEYASIARNLFQGQGYVGSLEGGVQLLFPPLYPLSIAASVPLTGDFEDAGRLVSLVLGTLLVVPVMSIAWQLYGPRVARIAGVLIAAHPLLATLSTAVYSEAPFITLLMIAVYFGLRCVELKRTAPAAGAGLFFGLAYLTRPEAMLHLPVMLGAVLVAAALQGGHWWRAVRIGLIAVGVFVVVAAPYSWFLYRETGSLRIEGKTELNFAMAARMNAGMSYAEASYGLGPNLEPEGPVLNVNEFVRNATHSPSSLPRWSVVGESVVRNVKPLYQRLMAPIYGAPFVFVLVGVAWFSRPWTRQRLAGELPLLGSFAIIIAVLLAMNGLLHRYTFPVLPFLLLWSAKGIDELAIWLCRTATTMTAVPARWLRWSRAGVRLGAGAAILGLALAGTPGVSEIGWPDPTQLAIREAGLWLGHYQTGPKRIFDVEPMIPYYAEGTLLCLPYADSARTLRYITAKQPDFIVLKGRAIPHRPFMGEWIRGGIPSSRARLIYESGDSPESTVQIYSWRRSP